MEIAELDLSNYLICSIIVRLNDHKTISGSL